jgi:hypothetical protein
MPPGDLTVCDNVVFSATGVKTKRDGFSYWDSVSDIPAVTHRSSSGTTRTLVFASTLDNGTFEKLVSGEGINIATSLTSGNEFTYYKKDAATVASIITTNVTDDTITYTATGSLTEGSTATSTITVERSSAYVKVFDYWRFAGSAKAQQVLAASSQPKLFYFDSSGNRKECTGSITARTGTAARTNILTFNERAMVFQDGVGNIPLKWDGSALSDLAASCPDASCGCVWLARIWTNDKENPDRLHYSATGSFDEWQGVSDSGAIDINPGDGDVEGITAVFPFKGSLFVAKRNKLYRITGNSPENFNVEVVTEGLGIESAGSVTPVDQNDVMYISLKGVHALGPTASYGDVEGSFLSAKIQPDFNSWSPNRLANIQSCYIEELSSIVFNVAEESTNSQDNLWLYDIGVKEWYRWPDVDCQSIGKVYLSNINTLFIGTSDGRLIRAQNGTKTDFDDEAIRYRLRTGMIYVDQQPITIKAFKRIYLFFKPNTTYSFTARVKIDQYAEQSIGFSGMAEGDLLGTTFILGQSILGTNVPFGPYSGNIDGYGHGIIVEVEQSGTIEDVDVLGFAIEYETTDLTREVLGS